MVEPIVWELGKSEMFDPSVSLHTCSLHRGVHVGAGSCDYRPWWRFWNRRPCGDCLVPIRLVKTVSSVQMTEDAYRRLLEPMRRDIDAWRDEW